MSSSEEDDKRRDREIAHNEAVRRAVGAIRVSGWAIALAVIVGVIAFTIGWAWLRR
ncbi:hypothetical protein [Bradyrhizobium sp.]|uniref:hypothetical protein n=1 Tax=Bradyrhizobium sp. TaxID=376 RepID=UPI003C762B99